MNILQIVRRYGPVGGMERYVWELSKELAAAGENVTVLCESLCADKAPDGVEVIAFGTIRPKPRWLAHLRFSKRVSNWVATHPDQTRIIHSHERTCVHHFTTFHGPPFAKVTDKPWWKRLSLRIAANLYLERRELCSPQVKAVIPNSKLIADALLHYYPELVKTIAKPVTPGVGAIPLRPNRLVESDAGVIGFVGKEWKRKGLDIAVQIVSKIRQQRPHMKFIVAGPKPADIRHLFRDWHEDSYELLGETDSTALYAQFDLLLHPARQEPYGMVIAEARAAGLPVVISDACGIADELDEHAVLVLTASITNWAKACELRTGKVSKPFIRDWKAVAEDQLACYRQHTND